MSLGSVSIPEIQLKPLGMLTPDEVEALGGMAFRAASKREGGLDSGRGFFLPRTVRRYGGTEGRAIAQLRAERDQLQRTQLGTAAIFAMPSHHAPEPIGIATIGPERSLHELRLGVPPMVGRRIPILSKIVQIDRRAPYVTAWTNGSTGNVGIETAVVFEQLAELTSETGSWTVVPALASELRSGIASAGYVIQGQAHRYDVGDAQGLEIPPPSYLYSTVGELTGA